MQVVGQKERFCDCYLILDFTKVGDRISKGDSEAAGRASEAMKRASGVVQTKRISGAADTAPELAERATEAAERASEAAERASEATERASVAAGRVSVTAERASEVSGRSSEGWKRKRFDGAIQKCPNYKMWSTQNRWQHTLQPKRLGRIGSNFR